MKNREKLVFKTCFFLISFFFPFFCDFWRFSEDLGNPRAKNCKNRVFNAFLFEGGFWEGSGRVLGRFWEGFGRILNGFWKNFGKDLGRQTMIRATKGKSMEKY